MTYLKDIKLCVDCEFYGTPHGHQDRCLNPRVTAVSLVDGKEDYPYCFIERRTELDGHCGSEGRFFILNYDAQMEREQRRKEFEEACKDAPF